MQPWQRTLYVLFAAILLSTAGFFVVAPFLVLYIEELNTGPINNELWVALVFAVQPLAMVIAAPIWGTLADRLGRKVMVQRAMFGSAVVLGLMGLVRSPIELVILRIFLGIISGIMPASFALVATMSPRHRIGYSMGVLQMALWLGTAAGPLIGGVIADMFGYRLAFLIPALSLMLAGIGVTVLINEQVTPAQPIGMTLPDQTQEGLSIRRIPQMKLLLFMRFLMRFGETILPPFLPVFVATLSVSQDRVSTMTGLVIAATSVSGALSAIYLGRLGDSVGQGRMLVICSVLASVAYGLSAAAGDVWHLLMLQAVVGLALGGMLPAVTALLSVRAPVQQTGAVYGIDTSIGASARVIAPLLGAVLISWMGVHVLFILAALIFVALAGCARVLLNAK